MSDVDRFLRTCFELMHWFEPPQPGQAVPGAGLKIPICSSLHDANLAAVLSLPYASASHFAPGNLEQAAALCWERFRGGGGARPYFMPMLTVAAAETDAEARHLVTSLYQTMINQRSERPGPFPPPVDGFYERLDEGARQMLDQSLAYAVIGGPDKVRAGLKAFAARTRADELIISCQVFDHAAAQRSFEIAMRAWATSAPSSSDGPASRRKTRPRPWPALSPRQYPFDTSFRCLRSLSRTTRVSS